VDLLVDLVDSLVDLVLLVNILLVDLVLPVVMVLLLEEPLLVDLVLPVNILQVDLVNNLLVDLVNNPLVDLVNNLPSRGKDQNSSIIKGIIDNNLMYHLQIYHLMNSSYFIKLLMHSDNPTSKETVN